MRFLKLNKTKKLYIKHANIIAIKGVLNVTWFFINIFGKNLSWAIIEIILEEDKSKELKSPRHIIIPPIASNSPKNGWPIELAIYGEHFGRVVDNIMKSG